MEVSLEDVGGAGQQPAAQDIFVSLRVGEVQKQGRWNGSKTYRFPDPGEGARSFGRVEVYQRVGAATISFDDALDGRQEVKVPYKDGRGSLQMKVGVNQTAPPQTPTDKVGRAKARMDAASRYLAEHRIEEMLAEAMREVICSKPDDPHSFLSNLIMQQSPLPPPPPMYQKDGYGPPALPSDGLKSAPPGAPPAAAKAAPQGQAEKEVDSTPFVLKPSVAAWRYRLPEKEEAPPYVGPWHRKASVGTWLCPAPPKQEDDDDEPSSPIASHKLKNLKSEEIVNVFQGEISKKDAEIAHLKRLLGLQ